MATELEQARAELVEAKRATVGMASTVLDPLPGTRTMDTALLLHALDGAKRVLTSLAQSVGLSAYATEVLVSCEQGAERLRACIRQEGESGP